MLMAVEPERITSSARMVMKPCAPLPDSEMALPELFDAVMLARVSVGPVEL